MSVKNQREKATHLQGACGRDLLQVFDLYLASLLNYNLCELIMHILLALP